MFPNQPLNIITDSLYVSHLVSCIYDAYISPSTPVPLMRLFLQLQDLLHLRAHPLFVAHIRSHQHLPGFLSEGNHMADEACKTNPSSCLYTLTAGESHDYFHQNKRALVKQFGITHQEATAIIQQCPTCSLQASTIPQGVNPRGTSACETWQMDVTQYPSFAPWKFIHVSIDTYSGFIMATLQRGETAKQVINHCIRTFVTLGCPKTLKTDNGPAYTSSAFAQFCHRWSIIHKFGIPFNSQGQAIIERANLTLKQALDRHLGSKGISPPTLPALQNVLNV
uniref:RNA-directed DNA polymerase n=1 Tax=Naja naja TaxID=35670 RepID=A0A8C6XK82_NAJNA